MPLRSPALAVAAGVLGAALPAPVAAAQDAAPPDVRPYLDGPPGELRARRSGTVDLGLQVLVAARGAPLHLRARRAGRTIAIEQVIGPTRRPTGLSSPGFASGIAGFLELVVTDRRGRTVARERSDLCPNSFGFRLDPLDPASPPQPTFGYGCGMPLSREVAWGIDAGWAAEATVFAPRLALRPGRHRATVTVDPDGRLADAHPENNRASFAFAVRRRAPARARRAQAPAALPDVQALPAFNAHFQRRRGRDRVRFDAIVWNSGRAPLVVEGEAAGGDRMIAYQRLGDERPRIGEFRFDVGDGHDHWHYLRLARYRLLDGRERPLRGAVGRKVGWCFLGTDPIDHGLPGAPTALDFATGASECGRPFSASVTMTLPIGWGDRYSSGLPGQFIDVTDVPSGSYLIEIVANPDGRLVESDAANNRSLRRIVLRRRPGRPPALTIRPFEGIDVEREELGKQP